MGVKSRVVDNPALDCYEAAIAFRPLIEELKLSINEDLRVHVPEFWPDSFYMKFLRARNLDVKKGSAMLNGHLEFRKKNKLVKTDNHKRRGSHHDLKVTRSTDELLQMNSTSLKKSSSAASGGSSDRLVPTKSLPGKVRGSVQSMISTDVGEEVLTRTKSFRKTF